MPATGVIADRLRDVVGNQVIVDADMVASYTTDWTGRFAGHTMAVVRPGSTDEVAGVVSACRELGVPLVPQGGNTGLVGGSVPLHGEVVLSLSRLKTLGAVDPAAGQVTAAAGVALSAVHQAARSAGWAYGVDLASRESATVGGTIATNAGGTRVLRYGDTRAQVLGVEAVLGTGAVLSHLGGLLKDNTGYHLPSLLCGSEGTLAVVTAARLRLVPALSHRTVAILAFADVSHAVEASVHLRRSLTDPGGGRALPRPRAGAGVRRDRPPGPLCRPPPGVPLGRGGRPHRTDRCAGRGHRLARWPRRRGGGHRRQPPLRVVALPRSPHRGHQHPGAAAQTGRDAAARVPGRLRRPGARPPCGPSLQPPGPFCSVTSATATST